MNSRGLLGRLYTLTEPTRRGQLKASPLVTLRYDIPSERRSRRRVLRLAPELRRRHRSGEVPSRGRGGGPPREGKRRRSPGGVDRFDDFEPHEIAVRGAADLVSGSFMSGRGVHLGDLAERRGALPSRATEPRLVTPGGAPARASRLSARRARERTPAPDPSCRCRETYLWSPRPRKRVDCRPRSRRCRAIAPAFSGPPETPRPDLHHRRRSE